MDLEHRANSCFLASFTVSSTCVPLYSNTANLWKVCSSAKWSWAGTAARLRGDGFVSGSNIFYSSQHVFFPRSMKDYL